MTPEAKRAYRKAYRVKHREQIAAYNATWRAAHPEYGAAYRADHPPDKAAMTTYHRAWYDARREELLTAGRARYVARRDEVSARRAELRAKNPERQHMWQAAYRAAHPEKVREANARRRTAQVCDHLACLAIGAVQVALQTNPHRCYICGVPVALSVGGNLHMDHVVPIARGGVHCADNLRPACKDCNLRKGAREV